MTKGRLKGALICYAVLALIAVAVLEGRFLGIISLLFGGLAFKSWLGYKQSLLEGHDRTAVGTAPGTDEAPEDL